MKILSYSKKALCLILALLMLVIASACSPNNNNDQTGSGTEPGTSDAGSDNSTEKAWLPTDIILSGDKPYRIVYSDGNKSSALKVQDKMISLDKNYTNGKYVLVQDTEAPADGTPEILVGATNRPASEEAKKLITQTGDATFYAIYVADSVIALYSAESEGLDAGAKDIVSKLARKNNQVIYKNTDGNFAKEYSSSTIPAGTPLITALAKTAKDKKLPVYSISVSENANKLSTVTVNEGNPCQNCYSVTKVYCVTAIGMLYDEGMIKTTDTIGDIFSKEIEAYGIDPNKWADITIHDVMRHRAGFKQGGLLDIDAQDATQWSSQDYLKLTLEAELDGNKGYKYTDAAFYLISRVVTKISGETLDVFLAKRLFNKTECREFAFATCPQGYPIGATGLYIRSADVAKLGRIYLDGGKYKDTQIFSKEWADLVIQNGYELNRSGTGYAKGGMRGQYLYINFNKNVAVAWHSYDPNDTTWPVGDVLSEYMK